MSIKVVNPQFKQFHVKPENRKNSGIHATSIRQHYRNKNGWKVLTLVTCNSTLYTDKPDAEGRLIYPLPPSVLCFTGIYSTIQK